MNRILLSACLSWFLATMFYAYQYVLRVLPNVGMSEIIGHFGINTAQVGVFSAVYYAGYTLIHIPIGLLIDRFSVKKVLPICVAMTSVSLLPLIYAEEFINAVLGRLLLGMASSAAVFGIFKVVKNGFGESKFSSLVGMSVTVGLIGAMYGGMPVDHLIKTLGWEKVINFFVITGLVFAFLLYLCLPKRSNKEEEKYHLSLKGMWLDVKAVFSNKQVVALSFIGGLMVGPLQGFADAWGTGFFESYYELDRSYASSLPSTIFLGMCFGCTIIGYITDKTKAHVKIVLCSNIVMTLAFSSIFIVKYNTFILYFLMFIIGLLSSYQISILGKVRHYTENRLADITSTASNMILMLFGTVFHTLIGALVEHYGSIKNGLLIIPIALILSLLLLIVGIGTKFFVVKS